MAIKHPHSPTMETNPLPRRWSMAVVVIAVAFVAYSPAHAYCPTHPNTPQKITSALLPQPSTAQRRLLTTRREIAHAESHKAWNFPFDDSSSSSSSSSSSDVEYKRVLMPRPAAALYAHHGHHSAHDDVGDSSTTSMSSTMTHVSWEEVLLAYPADDPTAVAQMAAEHPTATVQDVSLIALVSTGFVFLFSALIHMSGPGAWRYYLAGGLCAAVSHAVPVPIDVVKTRKQVDPLLASKDFISAMKWIIRHEGAKSLWAGLGPTTLGYLFEGSIKFGVYEATKPAIRKMLLRAAGMSSSLAFLNSHVLNLILCGMASGVAASIALCPMEALRIRLVAQKDVNANWVRSGMNMIQHEGVSSMTRGMTPMLFKQVPYTVFKNASFDLTTRAAYAYMRSQGLVVASAAKVSISVLSAALASVLSCLSSQPGDMLLSLMNAHEGERRRTRDIVRDILRSDRGIRGFFVGIKTRFVHVGIIVTLQLFIYDVVKQLCGIAATGSV